MFIIWVQIYGIFFNPPNILRIFKKKSLEWYMFHVKQ